MMITRHPQDGRRGRQPWQYSLWHLFALTTICAALFSVSRIFRRFPLETLILATVIAIAVAGVILYIGELFVLGWIVDFLSDLGMPKFKALAVPLDWEQVGEIIVVNLRDNIASAAQCRTVEKQLKRLIDEHHCDFVLDFTSAGRISMNFRGVMLNLMKAARREAENLGKPRSTAGLAPQERIPRLSRPAACNRRNVQARRAWMGCPLLRSRRRPGRFRIDVGAARTAARFTL